MSDVPLRDYIESRIAYIEARIEGLDKLFDRRMVDIKEATAVALKTIPTKEDIDRRLSDLETSQSYASGRSAAFGALGGIVVSLAAALVGYLIGR